MVARLRLVALLLALLAPAVRAQAPEPPLRAAWWTELRSWQLLAERWSSAPEPLVRAALARLAWEAVASDPAARAACERAQQAGRRSAGGALFLQAVATAGPAPVIVPAGPAPDGPQDWTGPLAESTRVLSLCARLDQPDGEDCLAAWLAEAAPPADVLAGLERVPAARARLSALADALPALGRPGPDVPKVALSGAAWSMGPELVGWLVASTPRLWVVEDERGERRLELGGGDLVRVTLHDQAVALLTLRAGPIGRRGRAMIDSSAVDLGAAAHDAAAAGQPWLAHALVAAADAAEAPRAAAGPGWDARLVAAWAQRRLLQAGRRFRDRASDAEVRALLEPARRLGARQTRVEAEVLGAALSPVEHEAPPTWAEWEAAGLTERLEQLGRALAWAEVDDPFPPDAPPGPDGRRPTVRSWLEASGWSGIPLRIEHLDDARLLRASGHGPAGLLRVADLARATPYGLGLERVGRGTGGRAAMARAWWEREGPAGVAAWWHAHLGPVLDPRGRASFRDLARDLGPAATPRLLAALGEAESGPRADIGRQSRLAEQRRARCLIAAVELEDTDFSAAFLRARELEEPQLAIAGAAGLARLEARVLAEGPGGQPRPALERLRSTARWLALGRAPAAVEALLLVEPVDPDLAAALTRDLARARYEGLSPALAIACTPGETLDRRLALCRLVVALQDGSEEEPEELLAALVEWRARARRGPSPPGEVRELLAPFALEVLAEDAPRWRDDPPRRDHAATTAALLGPEVADALSARTGLDVRALVAARLTQPDRAAAAAAREELAGCAHVRAWLGGERAALAALEGPDPGARLWLGRVVARSELPAGLMARAEALVGREVTAGALVDLLRAWADDPSGPAALRLELRYTAWAAPTLELSVATAADWPRCVAEARAAQRGLYRQTVDGAPALNAEGPLRAVVQALAERYRTGASGTLVATR